MHFNSVISYICTMHVFSLFIQSYQPEKNVQFRHQHGTILVATVKYVVTTVVKSAFTLFLHGEQDQESDHQTEETHSFR